MPTTGNHLKDEDATGTADVGYPRPFEPPSDELLLAAVDRAMRHSTSPASRPGEPSGVLLSHVVDHLGFVHGSWTTRRLRPQLAALQLDGALATFRRHGLLLWTLTDRGRRRLSRARRVRGVEELPESPQHRAWRQARAAAVERIDELCAQARIAVDDASRALSSELKSSDEWFEIGERLRIRCWRLGSATYCLREWSEPDERRADIDTALDPGDGSLAPLERGKRRVRRSGRRNPRSWKGDA